MTLEKNISDVISKQLEEGIVEKLVAEHFETSVKNALDRLFRSYGDVTDIIEKKIKEVMVPYLENRDYSGYIVKLETVLEDVLEQTASPHKVLVENFKELMTPLEAGQRTLKVTELYEKWRQHVAEYVDTDDLSVEFDDGPHFEEVDVSMTVEEHESNRSWSTSEDATILFECDHDETLNAKLKIHRWNDIHKEGEWSYHYDSKRMDIQSLRHLDKFQTYLMKLSQQGIRIEIDSHYESDSVQPEVEPEADYN